MSWREKNRPGVNSETGRRTKQKTEIQTKKIIEMARKILSVCEISGGGVLVCEKLGVKAWRRKPIISSKGKPAAAVGRISSAKPVVGSDQTLESRNG